MKRIYAHAEYHEIQLNLYIKGEEAEEDEPVAEAEAVPEEKVEPEPDESLPAEGDQSEGAGS